MSEEDRTALIGIGVVHPWMCDAMGHLTTRHYMAIFDDASYELFRLIGDRCADDLKADMGWADISHEIHYLAEFRVGTSYHVRGQVTALGRSSITVKMSLIDCATNEPGATLVGRTVRFDLSARKSTPIADAFRVEAKRLFGVES